MDKKLKNELFKVAVDYLFREKKVGSQKELAEKIGITEQSLSRVMNGGRTVSDKTLRKMNEAFGGIFNMAYFRGEDPQCMLMEDLAYYKQHPEEHFVFEKPNDDNSALLDSANAATASSPIDPSSIMNAALAAQMQSIELLKSEKAHLLEAHARELKSKEDFIQSLRGQLAAKDQLIAEKQSRIADLEKTIADKDAIIRARDSRILELERRIAQSNANDLSKYHFPIGAAEDKNQPNI